MKMLIVLLTLVCSTALAAPPAMPPINFNKAQPNIFGGFDFYQNGKRAYNSRSNVWKSQNIYSPKGRALQGQFSPSFGERYYK